MDQCEPRDWPHPPPCHQTAVVAAPGRVTLRYKMAPSPLLCPVSRRLPSKTQHALDTLWCLETAVCGVGAVCGDIATMEWANPKTQNIAERRLVKSPH
jgi:hypothetical protein